MNSGNRFGFKDQAIAQVTPKLILPDQKLDLRGHWIIEHYRNGKLLDEYLIHNDVVNVGKDDLLNKYFRNGTNPAAWYLMLIDSSGFTAFAAGDTMSSHTGWNEFTSYSEGTRVAWGPDAAASQALTNSTRATFTITGSGTIKGVGVTTSSTKGGTAGTLWATAAFTTAPPVENGDELKATYNLSC